MQRNAADGPTVQSVITLGDIYPDGLVALDLSLNASRKPHAKRLHFLFDVLFPCLFFTLSFESV